MPATAASTARPAHTNHGESSSPVIAILVMGMVRLKMMTPITPRIRPEVCGFMWSAVRYIEQYYKFLGARFVELGTQGAAGIGEAFG